MTYGEITLIIEQFNSQIDFKHQMNYELACLIAAFVNRSLNGKEIPAYDKVFKSAKEVEVDKAREEQQMAFYLDQWLSFANNRNKQFKQNEV